MLKHYEKRPKSSIFSNLAVSCADGNREKIQTIFRQDEQCISDLCSAYNRQKQAFQLFVK